MTNLIRALHDEIVRVRDLMKLYGSLEDGSGTIGFMFMKVSVKQAEAALESGEAVDMVKALADLKGFEG